jgi:hypothetical protein
MCGWDGQNSRWRLSSSLAVGSLPHGGGWQGKEIETKQQNYYTNKQPRKKKKWIHTSRDGHRFGSTVAFLCVCVCMWIWSIIHAPSWLNAEAIWGLGIPTQRVGMERVALGKRTAEMMRHLTKSTWIQLDLGCCISIGYCCVQSLCSGGDTIPTAHPSSPIYYAMAKII